MKRRVLLQQTGALSLLGLLSACGSSSSSDDDKAETTFLVYLLASDLLDGGGAERDLENMLEARNSSAINVVLQIGGGATPGSFPDVDMQVMTRYRLQPKTGSDTGWTLEKLPAAQQPQPLVMSDPDALQDFIAWGARDYPAHQYALCLWDHGGGPIDGWGYDQAITNDDDDDDDNSMMSLRSTVQALQGAGVAFELIGFDTCVMSSLEVAHALAPHSRYLVGSEEVTTGWSWTEVVGYLATHPRTRGDDFGIHIVKSYKDFSDPDKLDFTAYATTDLGQIQPLMQVMDRIADTLRTAVANEGLPAWWAIAVARRHSEDFQTNLFQTAADMVDVKSFILQLRDAEMLPQELVNDFNLAYQRAVVYVDGGEEDATGLMMYFPRYSTLNTKLLEKYRDVPFSSAWHNLMDSYTGFAASSSMPRVQLGQPRQDGTALVTAVTLDVDNALRKARPVLERTYDEGFGVLVQNGVVLSMQRGVEEDGALRLPQPTLWPTLQGIPITLLREDEDEDDNSLFIIPAVLDRDGWVILYAIEDEQGRLVIRWFSQADAQAGSNLAMHDIARVAGQSWYPLTINAQMDLWHVPRPRSAVVPQDGWVIQMQAVREPSCMVHAAVTDLAGRLVASSTGWPLPTA